MTYEVWAPRVTRVAVQLDGTRHDLEAVGDGWWAGAADLPVQAGIDYGYLLDDDERPLPDPRSRRQPAGVHELSRTVDLAEHPWQDASWTGRQLAGGLIYELHLGTFTPEGTLDSAIERLDHLVDLGVDFVELLPVNAVNGTHNWGYDGVLWYAVTENYGGPAAYQRFVDACHARGLAVIQDVVYNHLGPSGNYLPRFGPYLREASRNTWGDSVDFSLEPVRRFVVDNALMWMRDLHVDGLRLDAVHALLDDSPTHILQQLAEETDALSAHLGRPLTLIAESDMNDPKLISAREAGGYGLTAQWSDDWHHSVHVALTGETTGYYEDFEPIDALVKTSTKGFFHDGTYSSFRERDHGHPIDPHIPAFRLVTFAQDHDQIGNRATGDRLSETLDERGLALSALLTLTAASTPMLFMGEEWGASTPWQFFTSHPEPDLGKATAEGRIAEFEKMGWDPDVVPDPQDPATFERSKLDWSEPYPDAGESAHVRLLDLYRSLARLRREVPELTDPRFPTLSATASEDPRWFRLVRAGIEAGDVEVIVNFGDGEQRFDADGEILLATSDARLDDDGLVLAPRSGAVIRRIDPTVAR
ncbi:maltooligosyltrehalose trehalohydrolase [Diaminobutyricimonas aerilata]|uniref:Malto-oligosyltrehalose trehalohydrolase n=1 Tax=Diaminobutyricimonas aerilata TaxID=1162967 RepID=A0A2M9CJ37_9MICO|nr:malto-oligosyltrehalose trehalohydrolase [Diaminobutyricimonas aerilata]PJJ71865.1 maltooligosyltrehalose trehalohydrolase [Diaminobutyricimonas aerilata]